MNERLDLSRRDFVGLALAGAATAGAAAPLAAETLRLAQGTPGNRTILKGGAVLSMDRAIGDFEQADVLIEGTRIAAVGPNLQAGGASVIDATGTIVMPGFVDTHHHQYETILRGILADGVLTGPRSYVSDIQGILTPPYRPEDAYISELVASLSQINAGVTTGVDTSQVSHSPEHTDACIQGLKEAARRTVFAYSPGVGANARYPQDIRRLREQYFSSADQLLTLAMGGGANAQVWALAREVKAPIVNHIVGNSDALLALGKAGLMGPDNEYIHCTRLTKEAWKMIADTGGKLSIACPIEMQMRHGMPPIQEALDHGIRPSLSTDVETNMAADMFTQMRSVFTLQRALADQNGVSSLLTCRDVLEFATIEGARCAHLDREIGSLTPGKQADVIVLDATMINVMPMNNVPATVVTMMDTSNVRHVFIAGKQVKANGVLAGVDLKRIAGLLSKSRDAVLERAKYSRDLFGSCCTTPGPSGR
jgi:5-methylthioadenosine/S-adenosylhomocysteine deaminase